MCSLPMEIIPLSKGLLESRGQDKDYDLTERSLRWCQEIKRELFRGQQPAYDRNPIFFWSYGPQGSGKSTSVSSYFANLQVNPVELNIDYLTRRYAKDVLGDESLVHSNEGYFAIRSKWPTLLRRDLLKSCAENSYDIVWETTGRGDNLWNDFASPLVQNFDYKVIVVYVLVPFVMLKDRLLERAARSGQAHANFDAVLTQCRSAARNTSTWFLNVPQEVGGFVYFNNTLDMGRQQRIHSEQELKDFLSQSGFDGIVASAIRWRGISDKAALGKRHSFGRSRAIDGVVARGVMCHEAEFPIIGSPTRMAA